MADSGSSASLKVSHRGLSCTEIGYVRQKSDDGCNVRGGIWTLSYRGGGYAGETGSYWDTFPARTARCTLLKTTPWTEICSSEAVCGHRDVKWRLHDTPDLWVVFKPERDGKDGYDDASELVNVEAAAINRNDDEKSLLVEAQRSPTPARARFHACVYLHSTPSRVQGFHFSSHHNTCMRKTGSQALVLTYRAGLTCESLGVVEEAYGNDTDCSGDDAHIWRLSCQGDGYLATMNSEWNYER
ncbi:hypothetical protein BU16DRAFT_622105 [Lophium mytilinum]|uniref:Uncharacterized protein n=1 Tax=Lophium mytilinum TaxID=390894 RepID=A0A6A6QDM6_9PEZI|nr:hypothetical protein BU16DRAFT_622105 [Lophium mytilinum]